jgi:coenzyme F420-reducing hydrogenase beta subunit
MSVCPFAEGVYNPRYLNHQIFLQRNVQVKIQHHVDVGYYDSAFVGYSNANRATSASGGLLTWTLEQLLNSGAVDRVAAVSFEQHGTGRGCFVFKEARTCEEIRRCSGSIYHQIEFSGIISSIKREPGARWAITGVPCLCTAVRKAMREMPKLERGVRYILGLACGMYQNSFYTEFLCHASGIEPHKVSSINYRLKRSSGLASDFVFQVASRDGQLGKPIRYHSLPYFLGRYAFFRVNSCNACMDVFAETADACYMDAWLPEYFNNPYGSSIVLVRNSSLTPLFEEGRCNTTLHVNTIAIEKVIASQVGHVRRKRYLIAMRQGARFDLTTGRAFSKDERFSWVVQRYVQRHSKKIWGEVGATNGNKAFWRRAWYLFLIITVERLFKGASRYFHILATLYNRGAKQ